MFDMSWGEIMVIGGVALIVIGPKDLPKALRTVGQMTAKVRRLAGEFQSQFSEAMREAELQDVKKEMEGLHRDVASASSTAFNPIQTIRDELKGAVESKPADPVTEWHASEPTPPVTEPPGTPTVDPATLNPDMIDPETQSLVPLPAYEPPLPAPFEPEPAKAAAEPPLDEATAPNPARAETNASKGASAASETKA
jgi:sec-independent protein translocase protein TatB